MKWTADIIEVFRSVDFGKIFHAPLVEAFAQMAEDGKVMIPHLAFATRDRHSEVGELGVTVGSLKYASVNAWLTISPTTCAANEAMHIPPITSDQ